MCAASDAAAAAARLRYTENLTAALREGLTRHSAAGSNEPRAAPSHRSTPTLRLSEGILEHV